MKFMARSVKEHPYICLGVLILVTGLVLYAPFLFGDYIFAYGDWGYDTKHSYLPAYEFYANKIADFRWSDYDFSYGLGTSIFANISNLLDPFCLILILAGSIFGPEKIGFFLIAAFLLRNLVMGLLGMYYLKLFRFSNSTCILSSYVLSFCGYMMITGQHYQFASYAIFFIALIILCEKTIRDRACWHWLALGVALQGMISPYALFQGLLAMGVYCVIRVIQVNAGTEGRKIIAELFWLAGTMLLGLLISMIIFLPQCYEILCVSERLEGEKSLLEMIRDSFSVLPGDFIKSSVLRLFSDNLQGLVNSWEGPADDYYFSATPYYFSIFFPFCITQTAAGIFDSGRSRRDKIIRSCILLLMLFVFFFSFVPMLSNMFAYITHRFVLVLLPFFLYCFAETAEDLFVRKKYKRLVCVFTAVISLLLLVFCVDTQNEYSLICRSVTIVLICLAAVFSIGISISKNGRMSGSFKGGLLLCIAFSVWFDTGVALYADRVIATKAEYETTYHMPYMQEFQKIISQEEGSNFVRTDRTFFDGSPDVLWTFSSPGRPVGVYNSTVSRYTVAFIEKLMKQEMKLQMAYGLNSYGEWFNNRTADLLGLKYVVSNRRIEHPGWQMTAEYEGNYLYRNEMLESAGLLYDNYITEDSFETLDEVTKQAVLGQGVILDSEISGKQEKKSYEYDLIEGGIKIVKPGELTVNDSSYENYLIRISYTGTGQLQLLNQQPEVLDTRNLEAEDEVKECVIPFSSAVKQILLLAGEGEIAVKSIELYGVNPDYGREAAFTNDKMGNTVSGVVTCSREQILYMPIGYDLNWKAYVNGEQVSILRADYGFMGILLEPGENKVEFVYRNRALDVGAGISAVAIVLFFGIILIKRKKMRNISLR